MNIRDIRYGDIVLCEIEEFFKDEMIVRGICDDEAMLEDCIGRFDTYKISKIEDVEMTEEMLIRFGAELDSADEEGGVFTIVQGGKEIVAITKYSHVFVCGRNGSYNRVDSVREMIHFLYDEFGIISDIKL